MNYPDDFNTRTFPAGRSIAVSRAMGIGIMFVFFIIVCLCGLLIWTVNSVRSEPYVVVTGGLNDRWRIVMAGTGQPIQRMTDYQLYQQSLLWQFTQNWFNISPDHDLNQDIWDTQCDRELCMDEQADIKQCALFCASSNDVFKKFSEKILPKYIEYQSANAVWTVVPEAMRIEPTGPITENGGGWRIQATILINNTNAMDIVAYAKIVRSASTHDFASTMGYYIADFNAYRISQ